MTPEQIKELANNVGLLHIIDAHAPEELVNRKLQAYTDEANAEAIKLHMEGLSKDAVGVIKDEMRGEDGAELHYAALFDHLPLGAKLYLAPPEVEALQADKHRLASLMTLAETKEFSKSAKLAVAMQDNDRLRELLKDCFVIVEAALRDVMQEGINQTEEDRLNRLYDNIGAALADKQGVE